MQKIIKNIHPYLQIILILVLGFGSCFFVYQGISVFGLDYINLTDKYTSIAHTTEEIKQSRDTLQQLLNEAKSQNESLAKKVDKVTKKADKLQKIKDTDKELLQKYSKIYFLNENYVPKELGVIDKQYTYPETREFKLHAQVIPFIESMIDDAKDDDLSLAIISAYRSFEEQKSLKGAYSVTYGTTAANKFSADQGYSEHQLGTTVDFTTKILGSGYTAFQKTKEYTWLRENAYKYGFVLSYPENNKYYIFEPWHWRFVGKTLAEYLHDNNKSFYDMDQREIDEYILDIFES